MSHFLLQLATYTQPVVCAVALAVIARRNQLRRFRFVSAYLAVQLLTDAVLLPLLLVGGRWVPMNTIYFAYFYGYWLGYAAQTILSFGIVYQLFQLTLEPLRGLQRLGLAILRVVAAVGVVATIWLSRGPHMTSNRFIMLSVSQLQVAVSLIAVCLLLLVVLALRPMGLSFRSHAFGSGIGLGVLAIANLALASMTVRASTHGLTSVISLATSLAAPAVWIAYFARPEPRRRTLVLPPTSTLLRWNRFWLARNHGQAI